MTNQGNRGKVLLFNVNEIKAALIASVCGGMGIRVVKIYKEQYGQKVGALAGMPMLPLTEEPYRGEAFELEMMVMCFLERNVLDAFLDAYHSAGIPAIDLKAMLTPSNATWSAAQLYKELEKEHQQLHS